MLKKIDRQEPTPPSKTEREYLDQLFSYINQKINVFVVGPNGNGKTFLLREAINKITDKKRYIFDMRKLIEKKNGLFAYQEIIKTLTDEIIPLNDLESYINNQLIDDLNEKITTPHILFFDHFHATNREFYHHFSNTCRKISLTGENQPDKGCNKIVMVFSGTLILKDDADKSKSPLWNITKRIYVKPHLRLEANLNNYIRLEKLLEKPPKEELLENIFQLTSGQKFLAKTVIQVIKAYELFDHSADQILDKYMEHLWNVLNVEIEYLDNYSRKLKFHFFTIIEYLETDANILTIILNLYQKNKVFSQYPPNLDQICITGLVVIDNNKQYHFSNRIYEKFIVRIFDAYRAGDYCLFHTDNNELWKRAKQIYRNLHKRKIKRQFTRMITNKRPASSHMAHQIIQRLEQNKTISALSDEISEILTLMYDISEWSIYTFYPSIDVKLNFKISPHFSKYGTRIKLTESVKNFIHQVIREKKQLLDWTGTYQGIPVMIGSNFNIIFIYKLITDESGWGRVIPTFIKEAMMLFYNRSEQEKMSAQIKYLKESIPDTMQSRSIYIEGEEQYWKASKAVLSHIGVQKFTLHEILDSDRLRSSHSDQPALTSYHELVDINNNKDIKEFRNRFKNSPKGKIQYLTKNQIQLTGCAMQSSGNMMIIETSFSRNNFQTIKEPLLMYFRLIYQVLEQNIILYQTNRQLNAIKEILEQSQDYIFIVSYDQEIIFVNKILLNAMQIDSKSMNQLKGKLGNYPSEEIKAAFQNKEWIYRELSFEISNKSITTYSTILPLEQDQKIFAVAVIMQENTYRHELIEASKTLIKKQNISDLDKELLSHFKKLGFEYVIPYQRLNKNTNEFISEDEKKTDYILDDKDTHSGKISIWHRKGFSNSEVLERWAIRLQTTPYKLKADEKWPEYDNRKPNKDNFWITVPILYDNNVIKIYFMGWHDDYQWRNESLNIGNLRLIESFARTVGQIWENISLKVYQTKFQNMITHGIIEPLQLMRFYLEPVIDMDDKEQRRKSLETADANLEIAQSALMSILSIYVGQTRVVNKKIIINEHLLNLLSFFEAYATERANIDFEILIPEETIICYTDPIMLNQIFNNLVGNSIRQLNKLNKKLKIKHKILIKLKKDGKHITFEISDNGPGLSEEVKDYFFEKTFITKGMVPTGRLGIGFSKEIAEMLGGKLHLSEFPLLGKGTTYILTLPFREEKNES